MNGETGSAAYAEWTGAGAILLFDPADRPDASQIRAAMASHPRAIISFDSDSNRIAPRIAGDASGNWLELLLDGLTFDLVGLAPGPALAVPEIAHRFNVEIDQADGGLIAAGLFAGPHLAEAAHSLPVIRAMMAVTAHLAANLPVRAVCWTPARSAIAPPFFVRTVEAWLAGGVFPALGLVGFNLGADGELRSEGFAFLTGKEFAIASVLVADRVAAMRLAVRVAHELVGAVLPDAPIAVVDEDGRKLQITPDRDAGLVWIEPL